MDSIELPQILEAFDDLRLLLRGDVLQLIHRSESYKYGDESMFGAFHSKNLGSSGDTSYSVVVPRKCGPTEYLTRYNLGRRNIIGFENGALIVDAERVPTKSFQKDKPDFSELEKTLKMAKLR